MRLTDDEHAALARLAGREGLTTADLLRIAALDFAAAGGDSLDGVVVFLNRLKPISSAVNAEAGRPSGDDERATRALSRDSNEG